MTVYIVWTLRYDPMGRGSYHYDVFRGAFLKRESADKLAEEFNQQYRSEGVLHYEPSRLAEVRSVSVEEY